MCPPQTTTNCSRNATGTTAQYGVSHGYEHYLHALSTIQLTLYPQAHPKFGTILASSSYDGRVLIWRSSPTTVSSNSASSFQKVFESTLHSASVNLLAWAPHEAGCLLACASSDGAVSVLEFRDNVMDHVILANAHGLGVNSVSWAPSARPGSLVSKTGDNTVGRRFVTGGSDNLVKIWEWRYVYSGRRVGRHCG